MGAGGKVLIATAPAAAARNHEGLAGMGEVVDQLTGLIVEEQRADGNIQGCGLSGFARTVGAETVASPLRLPLRIEAEVDQGVVGK